MARNDGEDQSFDSTERRNIGRRQSNSSDLGPPAQLAASSAAPKTAEEASSKAAPAESANLPTSGTDVGTYLVYSVRILSETSQRLSRLPLSKRTQLHLWLLQPCPVQRLKPSLHHRQPRLKRGPLRSLPQQRFQRFQRLPAWPRYRIPHRPQIRLLLTPHWLLLLLLPLQ